jgi:hypothetical protein
LQPVATLLGVAAALCAISTDFQPAYYDVKAALALDLAFQPVKKVAFELGDLTAAQARHVDMIALWPPLVKMLFTLHVHQV